jgi:hypothetical protein
MKLTRESLRKLISEAIKNKESLLLEMPEEGDHDNDGGSHEGKLAKKDLFHMAQKSQQLHDMLADDEELDPWVQAKVTKAAAMLSAVFDHMMYEKHPGHIKE